MELLLKIETARQAELAKALMDQWLNPDGVVPKVDVAAAANALVRSQKAAQKPTPLEQAVAAAVKEGEKNDTAGEDPYAALSVGMEPAATEAAETAAKVEEKPKRGRKPKAEAAAPEPEKPAEDAPLTLKDVRDASTIALERIGAPVIQEALAKFEAIDKEKNALRMSALAEADYGRYIEFLKKKVNDAAKEWPNG